MHKLLATFGVQPCGVNTPQQPGQKKAACCGCRAREPHFFSVTELKRRVSAPSPCFDAPRWPGFTRALLTPRRPSCSLSQAMSANVPVPEHRDVEEFAQLVQEELELPDQIPQKGKVGQTARSYPVVGYTFTKDPVGQAAVQPAERELAAAKAAAAKAAAAKAAAAKAAAAKAAEAMAAEAKAAEAKAAAAKAAAAKAAERAAEERAAAEVAAERGGPCPAPMLRGSSSSWSTSGSAASTATGGADPLVRPSIKPVQPLLHANDPSRRPPQPGVRRASPTQYLRPEAKQQRRGLGPAESAAAATAAGQLEHQRQCLAQEEQHLAQVRQRLAQEEQTLALERFHLGQERENLGRERERLVQERQQDDRLRQSREERWVQEQQNRQEQNRATMSRWTREISILQRDSAAAQAAVKRTERTTYEMQLHAEQQRRLVQQATAGFADLKLKQEERRRLKVLAFDLRQRLVAKRKAMEELQARHDKMSASTAELQARCDRMSASAVEMYWRYNYMMSATKGLADESARS